MKYRKLTDTGDYSFGANLNDFVYDTLAIAQKIKTSLLLFYGEWWEDTSLGIPMFESILGNSNAQATSEVFRLLVEKRLKEIPEVESLLDSKVTLEGRKATMTVTVRLTSGEEIEVNA